MAEVLGAVASGITIAQVGGEILGTCLKIKRLMNELDEIPARLETLLNQVEGLAPIISATSVINDSIAPQVLFSGALRNIIHQCQKDLDQLKLVAESLSSQIHTSRGVKRRVKLVKALLSKDQITQCEKSLQTAVQSLSLALQTYNLILQMVQPEIIAVRILHLLEARGEISSQTRGADAIASTARPGIALSENAKESDSFLRSRLRLGLPFITGALEIYRPSDSGSSRMREYGRTLLQLKFRMPSWLPCSAVVDSTLHGTYSSWKHCLTSYRTIPRSSELHRTVIDILGRDDVDDLRRVFQEKPICHKDRLLMHRGEATLLAVAMGLQSWRTSNYLLDCGSEQQVLFPCYNGPGIQSKCPEEYRRVLKNDALRDDVRAYIFSRFGPLWSDTTTLRRASWPDQEYFSRDFCDCRHRIACESTYSTDIHPDFFRHVLSKSGPLHHGDIDFNWPGTGEVGLLHGLARGVGHTVWTAQSWSSVTSEVLQLVNRLEDLCAVRWLHRPWGPKSYVTPFLCLFMTSFWAFPTTELFLKNPRRRKIHARLDACDKIMKVWLSSVRRAGFDLREYAILEKQQFATERGQSRSFNIFRDISDGDRTANGRMEARLITFTYGGEVADWKLWWSEPTDELVGDFWRDIDPEPLCLPGSWTDDA